jgi:hypothetical protein
MEKYKCEDCKKLFNKKSNYDDHKNRKNKCTAILDMIIKDNHNKISADNKTEMQKKIDDNICFYCEQKFSNKGNMIAHMKNNCKKVKYIEKKKQEIFDKLKKVKEEEEKLKEQLKNIYDSDKINNPSIQNNTINNIDNNIVNNIDNSIVNNIHNDNSMHNTNNINNNNNIMLVNYGDEDINKFKKEKIANAMKKVYSSPLALTELIHFNPKYPEYHNIFIPKMNEKYAMVFEDNDWKILHKDKLANRIYYDKRNFVEEHYGDYKDYFSEQKINALIRFIEDDRNGYKDGSSEIKEEIKLLLYNNRKMAIERKKLLEKNERDKLKLKSKAKYINKIKDNKDNKDSESENNSD